MNIETVYWTMRKFLYQLASPKLLYQHIAAILNYLSFVACGCLLIGFIWGLFFAPADYQQGEAFRLIYIHVPCAFLSLLLYAWMGFLAVLLLIWRIKIAGLLLSIVAQLGTSITFLALVTGSIWGKPMWGTWWTWDARLTSELMLLFLYLAILALKGSANNQEQGDKIAAVFTLVGLIDLPIIHYSVYWWSTLHQGASLSLFAKPKIAASMLYPLLINILGFMLYCLWIILHKARYEILYRERRQAWVKEIILQDNKCHKSICG